jgi:hypothetical protein
MSFCPREREQADVEGEVNAKVGTGGLFSGRAGAV